MGRLMFLLTKRVLETTCRCRISASTRHPSLTWLPINAMPKLESFPGKNQGAAGKKWLD
jgi:hypothetical protein